MSENVYTPYMPGSATSEAAAKAKAPTAVTDEQRVLTVIAVSAFDGATDDEIERTLGMLHQNASARRRGLVLKGLVVDSGRTRKTRSGRSATVWIAKP
jgi:hypothetical protein